VLLSTLALRVRSMDPLKDFHKTVLSLDNCIIPNERLIHTPSSRDGVSHDLEVDLRIVGCEYIQSAGLLLRLPQVAMATAQVIFQRFYYSKSYVKYSIYVSDFSLQYSQQVMGVVLLGPIW